MRSTCTFIDRSDIFTMSYTYSQEQMVGLGVDFLILPTIAVGLRVWAKKLGPKSLAWDDYLTAVALVSATSASRQQKTD